MKRGVLYNQIVHHQPHHYTGVMNMSSRDSIWLLQPFVRSSYTGDMRRIS
jgi:hypothetical protein